MEFKKGEYVECDGEEMHSLTRRGAEIVQVFECCKTFYCPLCGRKAERQLLGGGCCREMQNGQFVAVAMKEMEETHYLVRFDTNKVVVDMQNELERECRARSEVSQRVYELEHELGTLRTALDQAATAACQRSKEIEDLKGLLYVAEAAKRRMEEALAAERAKRAG